MFTLSGTSSPNTPWVISIYAYPWVIYIYCRCIPSHVHMFLKSGRSNIHSVLSDSWNGLCANAFKTRKISFPRFRCLGTTPWYCLRIFTNHSRRGESVCIIRFWGPRKGGKCHLQTHLGIPFLDPPFIPPSIYFYYLSNIYPFKPSTPSKGCQGLYPGPTRRIHCNFIDNLALSDLFS